MDDRSKSPFDAAPEQLDLMALLVPVWKRKWVVLAISVATCAAILAWTARQPKMYRAETVLEYIPDPPRPLGQSVEDVTSPTSHTYSAREFYETQNRILASREIAARVVRKLGLWKEPDFATQGTGATEAETVTHAAQELQTRIEVERIEETRLVRVGVVDANPERAALISNTLTDIYIAKGIEDRLGSTVAALDWLSNQLRSLKDQLEGSEHALYDFKREHNVLSVALEDRQNLLAAELNQLSEELTRTRAERMRLESRLQTLHSLDLQNPLAVPSLEIKSDPSVESTRQMYRTKLAERQRLATQYGENHPKMAALSAELEVLRSQLDEMMREIVAATEASLSEVVRVEEDLQRAASDAHTAGIALSLQEIEYRRLTRAQENDEHLYETVLERTTETDLTRMLEVAYARTVDRAIVPELAVSPRVKLNAIIGAVAGIILGLLFAVGLHLLDRTVKGVVDVEAHGVTVLGVLPKFELDGPASKGKGVGRALDTTVHRQPQSQAAECCRTVRTNLTFMSASRKIETLLITSANPKEGKTTTAVSIAISLAQSGKRVLLVDTDLRRPQLHRSFAVSNTSGVTSVLVGGTPFEEAVQLTEVPGLSLLACGPVPPNPAELLHTEAFEQLIEEAKRAFDVAIFDSPPLGAVTDAAILAPAMSRTMVVVRARKTSRDALGSAIRQLRGVEANIVGVVLNDADGKDHRATGVGYYYYGDYSLKTDESQA